MACARDCQNCSLRAASGPGVLTKSHGLGNDYLVADPRDLPFTLTPERVRLLCDRHVGVGSDGLLILDGPTGVRIFNPDGSEAEKSGNGLRIFARWLYETRRVSSTRFSVHTAGGDAAVEVDDDQVTVDMGVPRFRDDLAELEVDGQRLPAVALSAGRDRVELLIWERGAGETRASGSSACALVDACHRKGRVDG